MTKPDDHIESVALIGFGALGCAYFGKIAGIAPMENVQVVADGERAERCGKNGVVLNGGRLDFSIAGPNELRSADLLIFAVKFNQLAEAVSLTRSPFWVALFFPWLKSAVCRHQ